MIEDITTSYTTPITCQYNNETGYDDARNNLKTNRSNTCHTTLYPISSLTKIRKRHLIHVIPFRSLSTCYPKKISFQRRRTENQINWFDLNFPFNPIPRQLLFDYIEEGVHENYRNLKQNTYYGNLIDAYWVNDVQHILHIDGAASNSLCLSRKKTAPHATTVGSSTNISYCASTSKISSQVVTHLSSIELKTPIEQVKLQNDSQNCIIRTMSSIELLKINSDRVLSPSASISEMESCHLSINPRIKNEFAISTSDGSLVLWDLNKNT
jgi:hypothetical protein